MRVLAGLCHAQKTEQVLRPRTRLRHSPRSFHGKRQTGTFKTQAQKETLRGRHENQAVCI